jgi:tetratricopeptide (TPR) repeat protein
MNRRCFAIAAITLVISALAVTDAAAWGPRARRAITVSAIQMIRKAQPSSFKAENNVYEEDVLRGAEAGPEVLKAAVPMGNDTEAVAAVADQIQLLRRVRDYGMGSYFAFRMGVLAALVADLIMPHGMAWSPAEARLRAQIEGDIDTALDEYLFAPSRLSREYVRDVREYVATGRQFYDENRRMIADDYAGGVGYNGFLRDGGQVYFGRAIEAVADIWFTVLRVEGDPSELPPSPVLVARYFVDEIAYLLTEKRNPHQANTAYERFAAANPGLPELYEQVGGLFYAYGTPETQDRAVREWRIAYSYGGPQRQRVGDKLANHYVRVGEDCLARASQPGASDKELPDAREAFTQALEFDRANETAAARLNETNVAIQEREERRQLAVNIIASAEKVVKEAERYRMNGDPGSLANAIATYKQSANLFEAVDDEFTDHAKTAKESVKAINKSINDVIIEILDMAAAKISAGDSAITEHRWDDAFASYDSVPVIVNIIPDEDATHARHKKEVVDEAVRKKQEGEASKTRFEDAQRAAQAAQAAAGGKPAATAAPAAGAPVAPPGGPAAPAARPGRRARPGRGGG